MTKLQLEKYKGRTANWRPKLRAAKGSITIPVTIFAVEQVYGRSQCCIKPLVGTGLTWVAAKSLTLTKEVKL